MEGFREIVVIALLVLSPLLIFGPLLVPVPPLDAPAALETLAGPTSRFVEVPFAGDKLAVHYEEAGADHQQAGQPALVLLHGFAASTFSWREVLPALGERWRTVAFDRPAFGLTERPLPESWQGDLTTQTAGWDRALWEMTAASAPSGLPDRLKELGLPVLVITGDDDRIVPTEQSVKLAKKLPNAQLVVVPACGHVPQEECPQAVLGAIETFLDGLSD